MSILIIINDTAAKAHRRWPTVQRQLDQAGIDYELYHTKAPGDASIKTRGALKMGVTTIAVVGGDGTLSEAAEGFFEFDDDLSLLPRQINPNASLALLPAGTGDDFARGLRGKKASYEGWIESLIKCSEAPQTDATLIVDVLYGLCNGYQKPFICLNASTMGIGGETAARVASQGSFLRHFSGEFRFVFAAVGALAAWRERRVRVTLDDRLLIDGPMNLAGVANALYAGGGMMLSPEAQLHDGLLDVITASGLSRFNVIRELSRIHKGGHVANRKVMVAQGKVVRIETFSSQDAMQLEADGNLRGKTPVQFEVMPAALKFVV